VTPIVYLYALVDEEPPGPLGEGIAGEPLRLVHASGIAAVTGILSASPRPDRETLEKQDAVVRRLAERCSALLPARFGEAFADEPALAERIASHARGLKDALALVRGCVQMTLRIFGDGDGEPEPAPDAPPAPDIAAELARGAGTRFLAARQRERERARSLPEIEPLREVVRSHLRAERMVRHETGRLLGTAYHLVPRSETAAYLAALEAARERLAPRRVTVTGPWPPYAFAPETAP
jgi:gas vesicle protein GvpL/GvpF